MDAAPPITDLPIYDRVLGDRLEAAREAVEQAQRDARQFQASLDLSTADALEQQAQQRAEALLEERTAVQAARAAALEWQLRRAGDAPAAVGGLHADDGTGACRGCGLAAPCPTSRLLAGDLTLPGAVGLAAELLAEQRVRPEPEPLPAPAPALEPEPAPAPAPAPAASRRARDEGPAAADVPSVPSMKDIFASTRAAGWLDSLLGARR